MSNKNLKNLYETDGYAWYFKNAELLKNHRFNELDIENLVEELESMGKNERKELQSYLTLIFLHLLKWKYQADKRSNSWKISINQQRIHYEQHLEENPSLKGHLEKIIDKSYRDARFEASKETGLDLATFPEQMPFTFEDALAEAWFPN